MKKAISTQRGPVAGAPYSQAIAYDNLLFVSGQGPFSEAGKIVSGRFEDQIRLALENLKIVLEAGGSSLDNVLKTTVFLADMNDFKPMNEVYKDYFKGNRPARSCIQAARLPFDIKVEIEAIAYIPKAE